jgi:hypothetical protein
MAADRTGLVHRIWKITAFYDGSPNDPDAQDLGVATAVPLPAAAWLLLGVSGALIAAKRRRARAASPDRNPPQHRFEGGPRAALFVCGCDDTGSMNILR